MIGKQSGHQDKVRDDLLKSMASLFSGNTNPSLLRALQFYFPWLSFALVINWIPEQGEDIYWILIDERRVAVVEVPRRPDVDVNDIPIEIMSVSEYQKRRLSVETRNKLDVALGLMREKESE
jgi:hypothetical protein